MIEISESIVLFFILAISAISYMGFRSSGFQEKYLFEVDAILIQKQHYRLFSSGFLHANWLHLIFNILALYTFGNAVGSELGIKEFLIIYFASLLAGNLFALFIHRQHGDYRALGASGAVSGVAFAFIVMYPDAEISFLFMEDLGIKAWLFGVVYMILSIYGVKMQAGNICHEAHAGGAIAGVLTVILTDPPVLVRNPYVIAGVILPFAAFLFLILKKPEVLLIENYWGVSLKKPAKEKDPDELLDELLEKVSKKGIDSLTRKEREQLEELSKMVK